MVAEDGSGPVAPRAGRDPRSGGRSIRAFVAVPLSAAVRDALARLPIRTEVQGARVRRVASHNLHLTLKFLGELEPARISGVVCALAAASCSVSPFDLAVAGAGQFPPRGAPRVLWAGVGGGPSLAALKERVDRALADLGFARETRPFAAHVTLARVAGRPRTTLLPEAAAAAAFGTTRVEAIALMASRLASGERIYDELARIPLGSAGSD